MGVSATVALTAATLWGVNEQSENAKKAREQQERAQQETKKQAETQAKKAEEATNQANQKKPDVAALLYGNAQSGRAAAATSLTGSSGVDMKDLKLGRNSLLGS